MVDLTIFEKNPTDANNLLTFSNMLSSENYHNLSLLVANHGINLTTDHHIKTKLLEQISISGFYSSYASEMIKGKTACELIALDRRNSWHTKNLARQNSTYYAFKSIDLLPNTRLQKIEYTPADDYKPMNPSVTNRGGEFWMIQRTVNYIIRPDGSYNMRGDSAIRTRNLLMQLDDNFSVINSEEIFPPIDMPDPLYEPVIGFEDSRLFYWQNNFWCTSTIRELNQDGYCEIVLAKIIRKDDGLLHYDDYRVIHPQFCSREHQKNWMPMVVGDNLYFVYSSDPTRIIDTTGNLISIKTSHIAADSFRGGSQLLDFDGGWLACIHESHTMPDNKRRYMHRFVWYDNLGRLSKYSEAFYIHTLGIEFAAGIARNHKTGEIVVSFGLADKESWLAIFDQDAVKQALRPAGTALQYFGNVDDTIWVLSETNKTLKTKEIVAKSSAIAARVGIRSHEDEVKNWDNLVAIWNTTMTTDTNLPVMDVGATEGSSYLPTLAKFGYQNLTSININEPNPRTVNGVVYMQGDCTKTTFPDNYFGFIACLSVIEHGIDINAFMAESSRILAPNGHLIISTDYWQDPVDTYGQIAFGSPVKVFTSQEISDMISQAKKYGLEIIGDVDLSCNQRVVNWISMDYTFINILFKKVR
jgi:SAM-dependent methyltransferase